MSNFYCSSAVSGIIKNIKDNPKIQYNALIVKCRVNEPHLRKDTTEEFLKDLIVDKQIDVNEKGEVSLC